MNYLILNFRLCRIHQENHETDAERISDDRKNRSQFDPRKGNGSAAQSAKWVN